MLFTVTCITMRCNQGPAPDERTRLLDLALQLYECGQARPLQARRWSHS